MQVSRDMAIDAGDLSMEGTEVYWGEEFVPCDHCHGTGIEPDPKTARDGSGIAGDADPPTGEG